MRHLLARLTIIFVLVCPALHAETFTEGFVTHIAPSGEFDVNGIHVVLSPKTSITVKQWDDSSDIHRLVSNSASTLPPLFLGQTVQVVGEVTQKATEIRAKRITISPALASSVAGVGIIDLIPASSSSAEGRLLRADGYYMLIPTTLGATFAAPLKSSDDIHTNQWLRYHGVQRPDGIVVLDQADFSPNTINHREDRLRVKTDYAPEEIDKGDAQSGTSKFFLGKDPTRLPAWHDEAMQARVDRIGNSLIPAFQKALSEDDPTRIDFRFQVTDEPKHRDTWSMPSGIILIPYQVVERLPEDAQLAAILADSIAEALEKQTLRDVPAHHKMTAARIAGDAAGVVIPGAGLVTMVANHEAGKSLTAHAQQQSGRVSLCLLHDAGYDIAKAPIAWWILASKSKDDLLATRMPDHTFFLFQELGTTWQTASESALPARPAAHPAS
jgi:hypothetical protein